MWANDNRTLFYVTKDSLDRPHKVWCHGIGSDPAGDACVFHEPDDSFYVGVGRSRDDRWLSISTGSAVTSDQRLLPADLPPGADWRLVLPRAQGTEYSASTRGDHLFITVRDDARPNSEVLVAPLADPAAARVLIPHRADAKIEGLSVSAGHLVSFERRAGLQQAVVYKCGGGCARRCVLGKGGWGRWGEGVGRGFGRVREKQPRSGNSAQGGC